MYIKLYILIYVANLLSFVVSDFKRVTVHGKTKSHTKSHTDEIRVHTSGIQMTYEHIRVTYVWHTITYEWHTNDIRMTYEYIQVTYQWHTNEIRVHRSEIYEWHTNEYIGANERHTNDIRVNTSDIRMTYEYIRVTYVWHTYTCMWHTDDMRFGKKIKLTFLNLFDNPYSKYPICKRTPCM